MESKSKEKIKQEVLEELINSQMGRTKGETIDLAISKTAKAIFDEMEKKTNNIVKMCNWYKEVKKKFGA